MPPGSTYLPAASITLSACMSSVVPMTAILSSSMRTSPAYWSDAVTIVPCSIRVRIFWTFSLQALCSHKINLQSSIFNLKSSISRKEQRPCFPGPPLFPGGPRRLARARPEAVEQGLFRRKRLEQVEEHVSELTRGGEQQPVVSVPYALGTTGAVVERTDRHAGYDI